MSETWVGTNHGTPTGTPQSQKPYIRRNLEMLEELPEPGQRWRSDEVTEDLSNRVVGLYNHKIIRRVEKVYHANWTKSRWIWETDEEAYQRVQDLLEDGDMLSLLPCGHSAIRNERDVEGITCGVCGEVHAREEVGL